VNLDRPALDAAVAKSIVTREQADRLWQFLAERGEDVPRFRFAHVLYYLGGLVAIGAMTLFMNIGWESFGGFGILTIASVYFVIALAATSYFSAHGYAIPAGITGALAVVMVPLAVYGGQMMLGMWPEDGLVYRDYHYRIDWRWLMMEFATLIAATVLLWRFPLPFMTMPVAVTLWYMSMDTVPFLFGLREGTPYNDWELRKEISLWFGIAMTLFAFWIDLRTRSNKDYAFWLYLFGVLTFWGGLTSLSSDRELPKFFYFCINVAMIFVGAVLGRRVFAVFGGIGIALYLGHLADRVFRDSMMFPLALSAIGLMVIGLGILWQRHEAAVATRLRSLLPLPLRQLIERRA
jgi:hypothetical protein